MLNIGCHLSFSKGYLAMGREAVKIGATTFQFFTRNPRGGKAKPENPEDIRAYLAFAKENGLAPGLAHAPYTLNPCAADPGLREFAREVMADDLRRLSKLPGFMYNFHPGSHVKQGAEKGIELIAEHLNSVLSESGPTVMTLETMAGKGSEVGRTFEELADIISRVQHEEKLAVCLDTCHIWDGGYDVAGNLENVLEEFDRVIGLDRLRAIHLNDSLNPLGSHKDRHAKIGAGMIGEAALSAVTNHPKLRHLPFYLETPNELPGYADEIRRLRAAYRD